jgi:hypothetical protein
MKKFLVLYLAPAEAMARMQEVPREQQAKGMEAWMQWAKKCGDHLVDMGAPLINAQQLSSGDQVSKSKNQIGGYSILQAENMKELIELMKGHPHIGGWSPEAVIEMHESAPLPGM